MTTEALVAEARKAVDALRDFAREHGLHPRQRDPLVMAIHDALDTLHQQQATIPELHAKMKAALLQMHFNRADDIFEMPVEAFRQLEAAVFALSTLHRDDPSGGRPEPTG